MAEIKTIEGLMTEARYFWDVVKTTPTDYQITADQATQLDALTTAAETLLASRTALENQLKTARTAFKAAFEALEDFFRALRQSVKDNPATTDVQRAELHLLTDGGGGNVGNALEFAPLLLVQQMGILQHIIRFFMQGEASNSTKKPYGVFGCKLYVKIGDAPPVDLSECQLITIDSKSPYLYEHDSADAGKKAHYIGVWVDKDDNTSPQSETFSITITG